MSFPYLLGLFVLSAAMPGIIALHTKQVPATVV
jgi:hypothetical protein